MKNRIGVMLAGLLMASPALAERIPSHAFTAGGGESTDGNLQHFSAVGLGMAVGRTSSADGITVFHGFLAGVQSFARRDDEPPVFEPALENIQVGVRNDACEATLNIPDIEAVDNRDRDPILTMILQTQPPQNVQPGQEIDLAPGSYDVLVSATDRRGNEARGSFRIDVVDATPPVVRPPNPHPTPIGGEAAATSPVGTPVEIAFNCVDACDPRPTRARVPRRFPVGDTEVELTCVDASGNAATDEITIRVRDQDAPEIVGDIPADFELICNSADGAVVNVPQLIWRDNAINAADLAIGLTVNPGQQGEEVFEVIPPQITLGTGVHTLRYTASDGVNQASQDLQVTVVDNSSPRIEAIDLPPNAWFRGDDAVRLTLQVIDACGDPNTIEVNVDPQPSSQVRNGDRVIIEYEQDGFYSLNITAEDAAGNRAQDNSIAFGIDRIAPQASVVVPSQRGVNRAEPLTFPFLPMAEGLEVNVGAEDPADGVVSGIRRVAIILNPGADQIVLNETIFQGDGAPPRGDRAVGNLGCATDLQIDGEDLCGTEGVSLRLLEPGDRTIVVQVEDFAGNQTEASAIFKNANLGVGMDVVSRRLNNLLDDQIDDMGAAEARRVGQAADSLARGSTQTRLPVAGATYFTPQFLGTALRSAQSAITKLTQAVRDAEGARRVGYVNEMALLSRLANSDLRLYRVWIEDLNPARGLDVFTRRAYADDMALALEQIDAAEAAVRARNYTQAMSSGLLAFFHLKMAQELWTMRYEFVPRPLDDRDGEVDLSEPNYREYLRGLNILTDIQQEISDYLILEDPYARDELADVRDALDVTTQNIGVLLELGINTGLSDQTYLDTLLRLQGAANFSTLAAADGAYVRVYQYAMMMVVRWLTHYSLEAAKVYSGEQHPIFEYAQSSLDDGVGMLQARNVQSVIDLYGDVERAFCPIIGVYHCWFLEDEERLLDQDDPDNIYPVDDYFGSEVCFDELGMVHPDDWANPPPGLDGVPPACYITLPDDDE